MRQLVPHLNDPLSCVCGLVSKVDLTGMSPRLLERPKAIMGGDVNFSVHRLEEVRM